MPAKPLPYHPKPGEVLRCDYSGLVTPEMSKIRWVVAVSPKFINRRDLCTVVPISTSAPQSIEAYHVKLDHDPAPRPSGAEAWVKCDMIMTVSFARLSAYWDGRSPDGRRRYLPLHVSRAEFGKIRQGVLAALGMAHLWISS